MSKLSDTSKAESCPLAAGLAPAPAADHALHNGDALAQSNLHRDAYGGPSQTNAPSKHGLLSQGFHIAIDGVASAFGKSDGNAKNSLAWDAADTVASFVKTVPLFLGPGRGTIMAAALTGLDEIHLGDSVGNQAVDFTLGAVKGASTKVLMDKFGAAEMSLVKKGAIIGGGSSLVDSVLSRHTWINEKGQFDPTSGMLAVAGQTAMGTAVGAVSFPIASSFGNKLTPKAQELLGRRFNPAFIQSLTNGASFGVTSGFVGETTRQLVSGEDFNPLTIAKRTMLEGASTMLAAGSGFRLGGGRFTLNENPAVDSVSKGQDYSEDVAKTGLAQKARQPDVANATNHEKTGATTADLDRSGRLEPTERILPYRAPAPEVADMNWLTETAANFNAKEYLKAYRDASRVDFPLRRPAVHTQQEVKLSPEDLKAPNTVINHVRTMLELGLADGAVMEIREPRTVIQLAGGAQIDVMNPPRVQPPRPGEIPSDVQRLMYREVPSGAADGSKAWVNIFDSANTIADGSHSGRPVTDADLKLWPEIALARMLQRTHVLVMAEEMYHFRQFKNGGNPISPEYMDYLRSRGTELADGGSHDAREEEIVLGFSRAGFTLDSIKRFVVGNYAGLRQPLLDYIRTQNK